MRNLRSLKELTGFVLRNREPLDKVEEECFESHSSDQSKKGSEGPNSPAQDTRSHFIDTSVMVQQNPFAILASQGIEINT